MAFFSVYFKELNCYKNCTHGLSLTEKNWPLDGPIN
jgi:hypothetical protein